MHVRNTHALREEFSWFSLRQARNTLVSQTWGAATGVLVKMLKRLKSLSLVALLAGVAAAPALSQEDAGLQGFSLNVGVSTFGATVEPVYRINESFGVRVPVGLMSFDYDEESDGETYSGSFDGRGFALMGDYYPFDGNFHLSAGLARPGYAVEATGQNIDVDGTNSDLFVNIEEDQSISPIVALGYEGALAGRVGLSVSAGAIFGGGFNVSATASNPVITQPQIDNELQDIRDDLDGIDILPYLKIAVGIQF